MKRSTGHILPPPSIFAQCANETRFENKKTFFFSILPDRLESLLVTFQNVKDSPVFGHFTCPKNGL